MNENSYIKDPIIRRYLGLDEKRWVTIGKHKVLIDDGFQDEEHPIYKKTPSGKKYLLLKSDEYAALNSVVRNKLIKLKNSSKMKKEAMQNHRYFYIIEKGVIYCIKKENLNVNE